MNAVFYIAKRYAFSKSKTKAINIIFRISTIGIIVSSMALFVVLSVFGGLERMALSFSNAIDPDLVVMPQNGKSLNYDENLLKELDAMEGVASYAKIIEERVVFAYGEKQIVANIKAVDTNYIHTIPILEHIVYGDWLRPYSNDAVLGNGLVMELSSGSYSNDKILEVLAMKPGTGVITLPENAYIKLPLFQVGTYSLRNEVTDFKYVYTNFNVGKDLLSFDEDQVSKIEFKLENHTNETKVIAALKSVFKDEIVIKNRAQLNEGLYKMLQTESLVVYLIFTLIIIVTLFSLTGSLIMSILEKKEHIKTLWDIGFSFVHLKKLFLYEGLILSVGGAIIGLVLGIVITLLQEHFGWVKVFEDQAYPVVFKWANVFIVLLTILILGTFASLIAANRIKIIMRK